MVPTPKCLGYVEFKFQRLFLRYKTFWTFDYNQNTVRNWARFALCKLFWGIFKHCELISLEPTKFSIFPLLSLLCNKCNIICTMSRASARAEAFFNWRIFLQCTTFFQKLGICAVVAFFAWTLNYDRIASILYSKHCGKANRERRSKMCFYRSIRATVGACTWIMQSYHLIKV